MRVENHGVRTIDCSCRAVNVQNVRKLLGKKIFQYETSSEHRERYGSNAKEKAWFAHRMKKQANQKEKWKHKAARKASKGTHIEKQKPSHQKPSTTSTDEGHQEKMAQDSPL